MIEMGRYIVCSVGHNEVCTQYLSLLPVVCALMKSLVRLVLLGN